MWPYRSGGCIWAVSKRPSEEVPFEQKSASNENNRDKSISGRGKSKYKDTETRSYLACSKDIEVFGVAGAEPGIA